MILEQKIPLLRHCRADRMQPDAYDWKKSPPIHRAPQVPSDYGGCLFKSSELSVDNSVNPKALTPHRKTTKEACKEPYRHLTPYVKCETLHMKDWQRGKLLLFLTS